MLVDWLSFVIISLSGILGGIFAYSFLIKIPSHALNFETIYNGFYIIIFSTIIAFTFGRKREGLADIKFSTATNMAGILSHEMKSSLAKLSIITMNIKKNIGSNLNKDNLEKFIPKLDVTIKEASSLVDDILIKLKKDTHNVELEILSIRSEIQAILADIYLTSEEASKIKIENGDDFNFLGNKILFKHLIYNLLKNSLYYTQHKSDADIILSIKPSLENNILLFKDTGDGINENDLHHIFTSFYSKRPNGTGFGLFFCKQVMSLFGGEITCSSKRSEYTEFCISFPLIRNVL
jgi:signal transduction histidine kinase